MAVRNKRGPAEKLCSDLTTRLTVFSVSASSWVQVHLQNFRSNPFPDSWADSAPRPSTGSVNHHHLSGQVTWLTSQRTSSFSGSSMERQLTGRHGSLRHSDRLMLSTLKIKMSCLRLMFGCPGTIQLSGSHIFLCSPHSPCSRGSGPLMTQTFLQHREPQEPTG